VSAFVQDLGFKKTLASPLFIPRKNFDETSYRTGILSAPAIGVRLGVYASVSASGVAPIDGLTDIWCWFLKGGYALELSLKKDIFLPEREAVTAYYLSSKSARSALAAQTALSKLTAIVRAQGGTMTKEQREKGKSLEEQVTAMKLRAFQPKTVLQRPTDAKSNEQTVEARKQATAARDQRRALVLKAKTHHFLSKSGERVFKYGPSGASSAARDQWAQEHLKGRNYKFKIKKKSGGEDVSSVFVPEVAEGTAGVTKKEKKKGARERATADLFSDINAGSLFDLS